MRPIVQPYKQPQIIEEPPDTVEDEEIEEKQNSLIDFVKIDLYSLINRFEEHPRKNIPRMKSKSFSVGDNKKKPVSKVQKISSFEEIDNDERPMQVRRLMSRFESNFVNTNVKVENGEAGGDVNMEQKILNLEKEMRRKLQKWKMTKLAWQREIDELLRALENEDEEENVRRLLNLRQSVKFELKMSTTVKNITPGDYTKQQKHIVSHHEVHLGKKVSEIKSRYEIEAPAKMDKEYNAPPKTPEKETEEEIEQETIMSVEKEDNKEQNGDFHIPSNFVKQLSQAFEQNVNNEESKASPKPVVAREDHGLTSARMITSYFNTLSASKSPETEKPPQNAELDDEVVVKKDYVRKLSQVYEQNLKRSQDSEEEIEQLIDAENEDHHEQIPIEKNFVRTLSQAYEDSITNNKNKEEEENILVVNEDAIENGLVEDINNEDKLEVGRQHEAVTKKEGEDIAKEDLVEVKEAD